MFNSGLRPRYASGKPMCGRLGLTLVEMLVVLGICVMLAVMLLPVVLSSRAKARTVVCTNNLKGLGQAFAVCLTELNGYLPDAYYSYEGSQGEYDVALKGAQTGKPDELFTYGYSETLTCPADDNPTSVLARNPTGGVAVVPASYAYNISLPLMFRNTSRVRQPLNTVTFYDGDPAGIVGPWKHSVGWAGNTVKYRHNHKANYLYLDGHVDASGGFPDLAFEGGSQWASTSHSSIGGGSTARDDGGDTTSPDSSIPFDIVDGAVVPHESCMATIICIGAAMQAGGGGGHVAVQASYRLNSSSPTRISSDVRGGETVVLNSVDASDRITVVGKCPTYNTEYASNQNTDHVWVMRNGDVVPSVAGFSGQRSAASFLAPYMDANGCLRLATNEAIYLFEMSYYTDYNRYSTADFQDLAVLVRLTSSTSEHVARTTIGGKININPNNSNTFEFRMVASDGTEITRDNLHQNALDYTGTATLIYVKPKGNGNQNGLYVNGEAYALRNQDRYTITSNSMNAHLYNDKRRNGKAMGQWWIEINAGNANIVVEN